MSSIVKVDTIQENTSANGITVDGLNIKDSKLVTSNSVVTANITDANVTLAKLAGDSVDATKIADNAISEEHLDVTSITGHTAETSIADGDTILIHDASASALRKMTKANFVSGIGGTNTPAFMVKLSAEQNITNATWTKITFDSEVYDTNNTFGSNKFTPGVAGRYNFMLQVSIDDLGDQTAIYLQIYKNGSAEPTSLTRLYGAKTEKQTSWCNWSNLADDDDYYEAYVYHDIGSTKPLRVDMSTIWMGYKIIE